MPVTVVLETLPDGPSPATAGEYLAGLAAGSYEPPDLLVIPVPAGGQLADDPALASVLGVAPADVLRVGQVTGQAGQSVQTVVQAGESTVRVVFLGVGDHSAAVLRKAGGDLGRMIRSGDTAVAVLVSGQTAAQVQALTEGILLGSYRFDRKSGAGIGIPTGLRLLGGDADADEAAQRAVNLARAVALARDLANTPSLTKSPEWLAEQASAVAAASGLTVRVWTEAQLAEAGFGGITAVGAGSERPPRLIELRYDPPGARRHVVVVGKGITFDSGGLSLKPNDGMKAMKTDMAGGGVVIAVLSALGQLGVEDRVTGLVAAAENMPSGSAYRPGDVITQYGGSTVEVLNTDAEGRLVLADAISYARALLKPDQIIDIATLTGAARIALGSSHAALYATSDELAAELVAAGQDSGDRLWRMPLTDDYRSALDSPVADLANVSRSEGLPGSITAALFLREFAGDVPWAHLDIAGAGRAGSDEGDRTTGATGFGTRLLLRWLAGRASAS